MLFKLLIMSFSTTLESRHRLRVRLHMYFKERGGLDGWMDGAVCNLT